VREMVEWLKVATLATTLIFSLLKVLDLAPDVLKKYLGYAKKIYKKLKKLITGNDSDKHK
jgi:hypothetical protein